MCKIIMPAGERRSSRECVPIKHVAGRICDVTTGQKTKKQNSTIESKGIKGSRKENVAKKNGPLVLYEIKSPNLRLCLVLPTSILSTESSSLFLG